MYIYEYDTSVGSDIDSDHSDDSEPARLPARLFPTNIAD